MTRYLYLARHGAADAFGNLTDKGRDQASLLGERLSQVPIDTVWHSPLPRAAESAHHLAYQLRPGTPVEAAPELIDHIPYVPAPEKTPVTWLPVFDGFDPAEAKAGHRLATALTGRFAQDSIDDVHEVLVTHAYPIAWLVRDALSAPPERWLELDSANTALTVIEYWPGQLPALKIFNDTSHLR